MKKILLKNARLHNRTKGILSCENCRAIVCNISDATVGYKIAFVCKCSSFGKAEYNGSELPEVLSEKAEFNQNKYLCPKCGKVLVAASERNTEQTAFMFKCECGMVSNACCRDGGKKDDFEIY